MKIKMKVLLSLLTVICLLSPKLNHARSNTSNPILLLGSDKNFGTYTGEILKAGGFNEFQVEPVSSGKIRVNYLKQFDIVILAEANLSDQQSSVVIAYVKGGGNLIAFNHDLSLNGVFGITVPEGSMENAYIALNPRAEINRSLRPCNYM
jgi:hypothetical protein